MDKYNLSLLAIDTYNQMVKELESYNMTKKEKFFVIEKITDLLLETCFTFIKDNI